MIAIHPAINRTLPAVAICAALSACAIPPTSVGTFSPVEEVKGRIVLSAGAYADATPFRVGFYDRIQREEYALYRGAAGQAEIVYMETRRKLEPQSVLDFDMMIEDTLPMWRFNKGQEIVWKDSVWTKSPVGGTWMRPYRLVALNRDCIGFSATWDRRKDDYEYRPSKAYFGYYCAAPGTALSEDAAAKFVAGIDIRGVTMPLRVTTAYELGKEEPIPPKPDQHRLLVAAQDGIPGGISGIPKFPMLRGRIYRVSGGSDDKVTNN